MEVEYLAEPAGTPQSAAMVQVFREEATQAHERMLRFSTLLSGYPDVTRQLDRFEMLYQNWFQAAGEVFAYCDAGNGEAARMQLYGPSLIAFEALREMYNLAGEAADAKVGEPETETLVQVHRQQLLVGLFALLVFVTATTIALLGPMMMSWGIKQVSGRIREITEGDGDLTARIVSRRRDEICDLARQFNAFISRMDRTLLSVRDSAGSVHRAADEIANGSQELASRAEQTAASLQETSASMEQITATVGNTSETAQQADQLAKSVMEVVHQGHKAMHDVEDTMRRISESGNRINDIITLIDGIAFQTNILALNASVEAARAGEHGRGFAVVTQEVRTLASRCGEASRDIRALIGESADNTQTGASLVRRAGDTMAEIVATIGQVNRMIG